MLVTAHPSAAGHVATVAPQPWRSSLPLLHQLRIMTTLYFALVPQKF